MTRDPCLPFHNGPAHLKGPIVNSGRDLIENGSRNESL